MSILKYAEKIVMKKKINHYILVFSTICKFLNSIFFILVFFYFPLSSQTISSILPKTSDLSINGIWENQSRFVEINTHDNSLESLKITLKPFYQYWYDGIYETEYKYKIDSIARIADGLYLEYWIRGSAFAHADNSNVHEGVFWRPAGNLKEISIDTPQIKETLTGHYILTTEEKQQVFAIRYWIANLEYAEDSATIKLEQDSTDIALFVDKYLTINGTVYTCATGRRTTIRNVKIKSNLPQEPVYSEDKNIMVLSNPYLVKSSSIDMAAEITKHNAIIYPPHSGEARFEEPSIYKKIEDGEVPLNGGSYFKSNIQEK